MSELSKLVDHMALILPFEKEIFDDAGIPCSYVGNPLLDNKKLVDTSHTPASNNKTKRIALLPGSRKSEIAMLLPPMLKSAEQLTQQFAECQFYIPVAETIEHQQIEKAASESSADITLIESTDYKQLHRCDAALVASGTATLELAILGVPMVVIYKLKPLSYSVLKRWLTIEHISLVNIIADKAIVPELLQDDVNTENLCKELTTLLEDQQARDRQCSGLASVYDQLGSGGASAATAKLILSMVDKNNRRKSDIKDDDVGATLVN